MGNPALSYTIEEVFKAAISGNRAVAVWRLPESETIQVCVSLQADNQVGQPQLESSPFGFLFCPFQAQKHPNIFVKADVYLDNASSALIAAPDAPLEALEKFYGLLSQPVSAAWHLPPASAPASGQNEASYTKTATAAIKALQAGKMEKVVLSRKATQEIHGDFDLLQAYRKLLKTYPKAFVSLVSVPGVGTWLGASPEVLVSIDLQNHFRTVALAGTQPAANADSVASAIWRQKEIEEQAMVERYILSCFKSLRLREYSEIGPRTVVAGNLMHLRTDFKVDLEEVDFPTLGSDMLQLLHPTSAVCGLPKEPALSFILAHENYDRSYYSGYLGPVNSKSGTHLYVNLRCMQLLAREAILYAGAGITAASDPKHEWHETQHKMQTMQRVLTHFKQLNIG